MTLFDLVAMAIHNLWQRRMRTALNLIGIVIGCVVLLMATAGATGVRAAFDSLFDSSEFAKQIEVHRSWHSNAEPPDDLIVVEGEMSDERRERIKQNLVRRWKSDNTEPEEMAITQETLRQYSKIEYVTAVVPHVYLNVKTQLLSKETPPPSKIDLRLTSIDRDVESADETEDGIAANIAAAGPPSNSMKRSLLAGSVLREDDQTGILVHEFLAYQHGFRSDDELDQLVGRVVEVEYKIEGKAASVFRSLTGYVRQISPEYLSQQVQFMLAFQQLMNDLDQTNLTDSQKQLLRDAMASQTYDQREAQDLVGTQRFVVRGVYRPGAGESMSQLFYQQLLGEHVEIQLNRDVATDLQLLDPNRQDFNSVVLIVDKSRHLKDVTESLKDEGQHPYSALNIMEHINRQIDQNTWIIYGVAAAILLTAAIGISNTLIISVMERTPEFGIMKSLGARDRSLVILMMIEGTVLGLLGAIAATVLSFGLSWIAQIGLRMYLEGEVGGEVNGSLFHFSPLSILVMSAIAVVVCVTASIIPAVRAARLDPVVAMRRT